jgi:hypothetical protein
MLLILGSESRRKELSADEPQALRFAGRQERRPDLLVQDDNIQWKIDGFQFVAPDPFDLWSGRMLCLIYYLTALLVRLQASLGVGHHTRLMFVVIVT